MSNSKISTSFYLIVIRESLISTTSLRKIRKEASSSQVCWVRNLLAVVVVMVASKPLIAVVVGEGYKMD